MTERITNGCPSAGECPRLRAALVPWVAALAAAAGCSEERPAPRPAQLLLVGVDGLEWELLLRFEREGDLPNLSGLAREGLAAKLDTLDPTLSPVVWTTIATGKRPEKHGITGFSYDGPDGRPHLFLSLHRQSKAIWNLFDDAGLTTRVFGWWCTLPAEPIRGCMVAQTSTLAQIDISGGDRIWKGSYLPVPGLPGQVEPPELCTRMDAIASALADRVAAGDDPMAAAFGMPRHELTPLTRSLRDNVRAAFYADCIFRDGALEALRRREPCDALLVYFGVTDVASHMFWRHFEPEKFDHPPPAEEVEDFGRVIRDAYRFVDQAIGELRGAAPEADLLVLSDHGFHQANVHFEFRSDGQRQDSGHHLNEPPGVLLASGPGFRRAPLEQGASKDELRSIGRVEDLLPTLLARAGIPYGEDMDGRPMSGLLSEGLLRAHPIASVKSHEDSEWRAKRQRAREQALGWERRFEEQCSRFTEKELERLKALGYSGPGLRDDPPPAPPPPPPGEKPPENAAKGDGR